MLKNGIILFFFLTIVFAVSAFGQGADSFYEFTVGCSQEPVKGGETTTYTVKFPPQAQLDKYKFNWSVSAGEIVEGQGKTFIKVKLPEEISSVTATVELDSTEPIFPGSQMTAQCTVPVILIPQPTLEDEIGDTWYCEEGLARLDSFFASLENNPSSQGYIVFRINKESIKKSFGRERQFRNFMKVRKFDPLRITFVRGEAATPAGVKTEFWLVPPGATTEEIPPFNVAGESKKVDSTDAVKTEKKPFIFATKVVEPLPECGANYYDLEEYGAYLKLNPKYRANIVIKETSWAEFQKERKEILCELGGNGITANRLKTFFVKVKPNLQQESTELWIVP